MAIDINRGPERVEVTPKPIGTVFVPGASTSRTAMLIATSKADAPLNTPISVFSMSEFEESFGTESDMGEAYLSAKGYYDNAGEGAELVIVAVSPSGVSGDILEAAENEAPRAIVGSLGKLLDDGEMLTGATLTSYDSAKGEAVLDIGAATGDYSKVKAGDFLRDAEGRLYQISGKTGTSTLLIDSGLDQELKKSSKGLSADGATTMAIVRLFDEGAYSGKMSVQEGALYGSGVTVTVSGKTLTLSSFDAYLNDVKKGDIIVDSASEEFIVTAVIDGDNIEVDRDGLTAGAVDMKRGTKQKVIESSYDAGSTKLTLGVAPYEYEDSKARFAIADSAQNPPLSSLVGDFLEFSDGTKSEITSSSIVAESTIISGPHAATLSYDASTGTATISGTTMQTDGAKSGDVLIDATGKEYVIHEVLSETELRIDKNIASPSSLTGAKVHKGAIEVEISEDISAKVAGEPGADTTGEIKYKANSLSFDSGASMASDDYFLVEPSFESTDFIGSEADFSGLRALDAEDTVNLVTIPGIYDPAVQGAAIDYCSVTRPDCMALVSIPEFITSASKDSLVVANLVIGSVQEATTGAIVSFSGSPDLSSVSTYDLLKIGTKQFTVKAVSDEDDKIVLFETTGIPTVGATSVQSPSAISWKDTIVNKPTTKASWYFNHLVVTDSEGGSAIVDPVGHVAGVMARIDSNIAEGGVSHAPAGIRLAQLAGTTGLQLQLSERLDGGPLRLAFINRITSSTGNGRYIFGGYTAAGDSATPDEQLIQVIRSVLFIKSSLETGLVGFLWENNSPVNRQNITNAILAFLRTNAYLFPAGLPEDQQFIVESITPDTLALAQGLVKVRLQVRFNTAIRFIDIDLEFPLPVSEA